MGPAPRGWLSVSAAACAACGAQWVASSHYAATAVPVLGRAEERRRRARSFAEQRARYGPAASAREALMGRLRAPCGASARPALHSWHSGLCRSDVRVSAAAGGRHVRLERERTRLPGFFFSGSGHAADPVPRRAGLHPSTPMTDMWIPRRVTESTTRRTGRPARESTQVLACPAFPWSRARLPRHGAYARALAPPHPFFFIICQLRRGMRRASAARGRMRPQHPRSADSRTG